MILVVINKQNFIMKRGKSMAVPVEKGDHLDLICGGLKRREAECKLHTLIHTFAI